MLAEQREARVEGGGQAHLDGEVRGEQVRAPLGHIESEVPVAIYIARCRGIDMGLGEVAESRLCGDIDEDEAAVVSVEPDPEAIDAMALKRDEPA